MRPPAEPAGRVDLPIVKRDVIAVLRRAVCHPHLPAATSRRAFGGEKAPWNAFWGQRDALLGDPDGARINLCAALG